MSCDLLCLASFIEHHAAEVHPRHGLCPRLIPGGHLFTCLPCRVLPEKPRKWGCWGTDVFSPISFGTERVIPPTPGLAAATIWAHLRSEKSYLVILICLFLVSSMVENL